MKNTILLGIALTAGLACSREATEDSSPAHPTPSMTSSIAVPTSGGATNSGGGGTYIPTLLQVSVPPGSTSVDVAPKVGFKLVNVLASEGASVVASAAPHLQFVDTAGRAVAADGQFLAERPTEMLAQFSPKTALRSDAWYWVVSDANPDVLFVSSTDGNTVPASASRHFESRFFTGSAPHVIDASFDSGKAGQVDQLRLLFSESVLASTLETGLGLQIGAAPLAGCTMLSGNVCVSQQSQMYVSLVVYKLNTAVPPSSASTLALTLGGSVQGSGRTVGAGFAAAGLPGKSQSVKPNFTACGSGGGCWHEPQGAAPTVAH